MNQHLRDWAGRVALVTGATSGIGAAIAKRLAGLGMKVAICGRRLDRLEALCQTEGEFLPLEADLRDPAQIQTMFATIKERWSGVQVLVNNAGCGFRAPLIDGDPEKWRQMFELNVLALSICTKEALATLLAGDAPGYIFHIGSMSGHRVPPNGGFYAASKYAVRALTEGLRSELRGAKADHIRITSVSPGFVDTEFFDRYHDGDSDRVAEIHNRVPEMLNPEDIADTIEFALGRPAHMQLHDLLVRPTKQVN